MIYISSVKQWELMALLLIMVTTNVAANSDGLACPDESDSAEWQLYKQKFMTNQGRVVDTGNGGISHSEGQGFGMRLAAHYGEREDFARIWKWTQEHLYVRDDHLAAWRWQPDNDPHIEDKNNASDGDLFIAWSLALAGRCWGNQDYIVAARQISEEIRNKLIQETSSGDFLLPGTAGFVHGDQLTLNPSYWVFPAISELAVLEPDAPEWPALIETGYALLDQLKFGRWNLVPDWVSWSPKAGFSLSEQFPPRFGYDAIRVPLYVIWHGRNADILTRLSRYWEGQQRWAWRPDWVNLKTDAISSYAAPVGIASVTDLTQFARASYDEATAFLSLPSLNAGSQKAADYYSASLILLARIAVQSWCRQHDCVVDGH